MVKVIRENEVIEIKKSRIDLYKKCGWKVISELFTFESETEKNNAWMEKFGN